MADQSEPDSETSSCHFLLAGALACGFFEPQEQVRQKPGGPLIASLREVRQKARISHLPPRRSRANPVDFERTTAGSELDWHGYTRLTHSALSRCAVQAAGGPATGY